jgi:uncharacterized glyoxalase superfamily protein PhnB
MATTAAPATSTAPPPGTVPSGIQPSGTQPTGDLGVETPGVVPYLIVDGAAAALDWYVAALGARRCGEPIMMPDGRVGHSEMELSGSLLYLADESPESHVAAPRPGADATVSLTVLVADVDRSVERARHAGAVVERPAADNPYGRNAVVRDPYGHRWILSATVGASAPAPSAATPSAAPASPPAPSADTIRQGDIAYMSLWVPDGDRAFSTVLGWSYGADGGGGGHRRVEGARPHHGLVGGQARSNMFLCFAVDDLVGALARVRAAGGRAGEPSEEPFGTVAMCVDDSDTQFALYQLPDGRRGPRPPLNGTRHGDLSYITMEVVDSARVCAFFGAVLGWRFNPGHVEDGWGPDDVAPMTGLHGGHDVATVVPMYRVDDIDTAVARVRTAGGSAPDPERHPYGLSALCIDDQGTRFYLGQH